MDGDDLECLPLIRVLITMEVRVLRDGLASLLRQRPSLAVVDEVSPAEHSAPRSPGRLVDVVLLDSFSGTEQTCKRIEEMKASFPTARPIVVGAPARADDIIAYVEAGAAGYTLVDSPVEELVATIEKAYRGEASCAPDILAALFERITLLKRQVVSIQDSDLLKLTRREMEVLQLLADGMSNKEIATTLQLELQTVKNYVHNILEKLHMKGRREAAVYSNGRSRKTLSLPPL